MVAGKEEESLRVEKEWERASADQPNAETQPAEAATDTRKAQDSQEGDSPTG